MPNNLVSLLRDLQPTRALFTSYTFDLGFFEGLLLAALHKAGCQSIHVLVDTGVGFEASLDVEYGGQAGLDYGLHGITAPGHGVFHPKIAYLTRAAPNPDVLVVGSGNLTAAGQGLQLECLDAVSAERESEVFLELARFCQTLAGRLDPRHPAQSALVETAQRAMAQGQFWQPAVAWQPRRAWLVHTLAQTAEAQFIALCHEAGLPSGGTLTVLSPFHSADGAHLATLARQLGAARLQLGLDPAHPVARCAFPGDLGAVALSYVLPDGDEVTRPLHAKVFCYDTPQGSLVMTGSVNATHTSLASRDNVEVSLVRRHDQPVFLWRPVEAAHVPLQPMVFVPGPKTDFPLTVTASMREGRLSGYVEGVPGGATVSLALWVNGERRHSEAEVVLDAAGGFVLDWPGPDTLQAMQVHVTHGAQTGRGWLMRPEVLADAAGHRAWRKRLSAIGQGPAEDMEAELFALVLELMVQQQQATPAPQAPPPLAATGAGKDPVTRPAREAKVPGDVTVGDLANGFRPRHLPGAGGTGSALYDLVWRFLERGRAVFAAPDLVRESDDGEDDPGEEDLPPRGGPSGPANEDGQGGASHHTPKIAERLTEILALAATPPFTLASCNLLLLYPRAVLHRAWAGDPASWPTTLFRPCLEWLRGLNPDTLPLADWPTLRGAAVEVVVLLMDAGRSSDTPLPLVEWHDALALILGEPLTAARLAEVLAEAPLLHQAWGTLAPEAITRCLALLADTTGSDQRVANVVSQAVAQQPLDANSLSPGLRELHQSVRQWAKAAPTKRPVLGVFTRHSHARCCPLCQATVPPGLLPELRRQLALRAPCNHLLVYLRDGAALRQFPVGLYREGRPHV